jgi:hypothetical protein
LEKFLASAKKFSLMLNKEKCKISVKSVTLLGYVIFNKMIKPDPDYLQLLLDLPIPRGTSSLQWAIGMILHSCKWVPRFSEKMCSLLQKKPFSLLDEAISAFSALKDNVSNAVMAAIEDDVPFRVETDASDFGIAATLSQAGQPVAFFSRTLNKSEQ